ncbi:finger 236-like [Octopus vulgaris]|uniref:Finger 236-like n=1 Tax=Octopus vulgaris TaxID=6645 RepID=A0AA36EWS6_OCTVU|nr:finger 236-like [Octopus vulgaris]
MHKIVEYLPKFKLSIHLHHQVTSGKSCQQILLQETVILLFQLSFESKRNGWNLTSLYLVIAFENNLAIIPLLKNADKLHSTRVSIQFVIFFIANKPNSEHLFFISNPVHELVIDISISSHSNKMSTDKHSSLKSRKSIKKHRCEFCNKEFMSSSALVIHRRSHTGLRPYKCPFCSRAFSQMTGIQHHIRTHTGERPYVCNICHFKFSRSDSLARHIKKRHSSVQNGLVKRKKKTSEISKKQLLLSYYNNSHSDPTTSQLTDSSFILNGFLDAPTEFQSSNLGINSDVHITDDSSKNSRLKFPDEMYSHNKVTDSFIRDKKYTHSRIQSPRLRTKSMDKKYSFSNCNLPEFRYSEAAHQRISVPQNEISENSRKNYKRTEETSLLQSKVNKRCNYNPNISYTNNLDNIHFKNVSDISISSELESKLHNKLDNYQHANRRNLDTKSGGKYHKCFFCFKCFASKSALNIHKRIHTGIRPYVCKMCGRSFTQKTGLRHHYRTHTQERPYKCSICFYAFARSDSLLRHTKLRHKKLKKKAPVYNKQLRKPPECYPNSEHFFEKSGSFKQVVLQNESNNLFENDRLVAKNVNDLDIHEYSIRNNNNSNHVSVVDSTLLLDPLITVSDEINYGRHHVQSTDFSNSNLSSGVVLNIERPEITHTNSPIYITDDEEEFDVISFPEKNEDVPAVKSCLKPSTNSKNTTGKYGKKRNLPCNFCHKTFSSFSVLKVHRRIHTGVRPYRCKFCGRSFTQQTGLTHHLRTHTGEKPYSCGNCNAQFSRSDSLARHWKQQHLKHSNTKGNHLKQINRTKKDHVSSSSTDENLSISAKDVRLSESETNNVQEISDNTSSLDQVNFASVVIKSEVSNDEPVPAVICDTSSKEDAGTADKLGTDDLSPTWKSGSSYRDDGNFSNIEIETFEPVRNAFSPSNEPNLQLKCSSCKKVFNDKTLLSSHVCEVNTEYQCFLCDMNFNNTILLAEHMSEQHNLKQNCKREGELSQFSFEDEFGSLVEMVITHNNDRDVCRIYLSDFSENTQTIEMNMDEKINQNLSDIWESTENRKLEVTQNSPDDFDSKANIFCQSNYNAGTINNHKDSSEDILQIKLEQDQQEISDLVSQNNSSFESFCLTNQEQEFRNVLEPNTNPLGTQTNGINSEVSNFVDNSSDAGISIPLLDLNQCKTEDNDSNTAPLNKDSKQTRNKQRQCEFCKKSFNSKWALIIHRRSHTGEKPYECGHCGRGFSQLSGVQHHILTHTGERPFECQICHFRFARSDSLVRHTRLKHSECARENGSKEEPKKASTLSNNQSLVRDLRNAYSTDMLDMETDMQNDCTMIEPMLQDKNLINLSEYPLLLSSQVKEPDSKKNVASNSEDHITLKDIHKEVDFDKDIKNCNMLDLSLPPSKDISAKQIKTFDCKFCGSLFPNSDVLLQHLMLSHSNEIILNDIKTDILLKSGPEQNKNSSQDSLSISESKETLTFHSSNVSSFPENYLQRDSILHLLKEYDLGMVTEDNSTLNRDESNPNFNVDLKYIENVETIPLDRLEQNGDGQEMDRSQNSFQNIIDITETDFDLKETSVDEIIEKDLNTSEERNLKDVDVGNVEDNNNNNNDDDDDDDDDDVICITPENFPSSFQMNSLKGFAEDFHVTEEKSYEASYISLTDNDNMSAREITEQSNRSNSCRFCGKSFPTQSALKVHQRTHTGLRPYKCPTCDRAFTQKVGLQHHVRTHTGERPYQCKYCIQKFARSDSLGRHIRHKHLKTAKDLNSVNNYQKSLVSPLSLESDANQEAARKREMNGGNSNQLESNFIESPEHSSSKNPNQTDFVMMTPNSFGDLFVLEPSDNHVKNNLNECFQEYISYSRLNDDNHIDRKTMCDQIEERKQNSSYSIPNTSLLQSSGNTPGNSSDTIVLEEMAINISDSECNSPEQNTTIKYENDLTCDICCKEFSNSHLLIKHLKDHINASKETATNPDKTISGPVPTCYLIDLSDESLEQKTQSELDIDLMESDLLSNITKEKCMENKNVTEIQEFNSRTDPKIASSSLTNLIDDDSQTQIGIEKNADNYQLVTETEDTNTTTSVLSNMISPNLLPHHTNVVSTGTRDNITCSKTNNNSLLIIKDGTRFKLGHKRHICKYCSKSFASSSALVIHTRTHTGERPYECDYCSRAFSQVTGLRHHIRTHTGYKPYSCHFCYYRFARSDSLARHLKLEHQKRNKDSSSGTDVNAIQ